LALMRRRRRVRRKAVRRATLTPELQTLHKLLATVDRRARSVGVHRGTHETLHAFAARIRPMATESDGEIKDLADWYLAYAGLRYGRTISPERIVELQRFFQKPQKAF